MAVRLDKKSWWVDFRFNHRRYRKRSPENSRAGAQAYEATLRQKLARGESIDEPTPTESASDVLFEAFAEQWFKTYVVPNNKPSEQYAKRKMLDASLLPFFGKLPLRSITTKHVERYKAHLKAQGLSNKTVNNRLAALRKCLRCAYDWEGVPMPDTKPLRCPPPKTDFRTPTECDLLLRHAEGQLREMVFVALRTGMRLGEILGLQWESIDWQNDMIIVRHSLCGRTRTLHSPKSNRERHIPMDRDVRRVLFDRKKELGYVFLNPDYNAPYTEHRMQEELRRLCKKAGVRKTTWHVLRHTFATQLAMRGVPLTVVKELLGHSSITTTMRYLHGDDASKRAAIELLNPRSRIPDFGQPVVSQESLLEELVDK